MHFRSIIKAVLLLICIVGLFFLPMSEIFLYSRPMKSSVDDFIRASSENVEHTDYTTTDISTFVNDYFIFYVPPPTIRELDVPFSGGGYVYRSYYNGHRYIVANMSSIQLFSYENGAKITVEWLNGTAIYGTKFDYDNELWYIENYNTATVKWLEELPRPKELKRNIKLGEYESEDIQLNNWEVRDEFRILSGVVKITSDYPISVMHHRLYPIGTLDDNGYELINHRWDGVYSAYGKKFFTRIPGDCWISALDADTTVNIWDYSDKNDDTTLILDRFEGWAYTRNPIYEQYGFDDDLVLISADKPISLVAGLQSEQGFTQVFGKDGRDFLFPCFGKILIHAPNGATIDLKDKSGNQGSYKGTMKPGEIKLFDFKVAYKQKYHSSFEWANLRSSEPILVYTFADNSWYLDENVVGMLAGEEYLTVYKKVTEYYSHGYVPYPASTNFKISLRSRAYLTVVNLDKNGNDVEIEHSRLILPYKTKMEPYSALTLDFSEDSYYYMDLYEEHTPEWTYSDEYNRYYIDDKPHIIVDYGQQEDIFLDWNNITKGSIVKIKSEHPVLVFINYNKDQSYYPQGIDLIPGLTPPTKRGLPELPAMIVAFSGMIIVADVLMIAVGKRSIVEVF